MSEGKYSFQKTYTLLPQSPLIHFQWNQQGAALRATEVKPKLDKYIVRRYGIPVPDDWLNKQSPNALKYKLRFEAVGEPEITLIGFVNRRNPSNSPEQQEYADNGCPYDIYYGNMGTNEEKRGVIVNTCLTVNCFIPELLQYIDSIIGDFFIVTNFGTMQGKGFGSYIVDSKPNDSNYICQTLMTEYQAKTCYRFKASRFPFDQIKCVYSLLKTGLNQIYLRPPAYRRSILFDYMHEQGIGNEKAWMKQKHIVPALGRNPHQHDAVSRYVRALFGIGEAIEFKNSMSNPRDKVKVTIKESEKEIDRLNSPVLFKVINHTVYFLGTPIHEEIYGKTFTFLSSIGKGEIMVPRKEELPDDFINDFMHYAFGELNRCRTQFRDIQNMRLEEVNRSGHKYIAVTIGPIFDTINLASSPSALWAASYLFSMLSKNICKTLTENGIDKENIISPYYDPDDRFLNRNDGVGLFHDRIIFRANGFSIKDFNDKIKDEAIKKTLALFQFKEEDVDYFKKYFLISAFVFESDSPILGSAKALDCLELSKPFAEEHGSNPLLTLYTSDDNVHRNQQLTTLVKNMGIDQWQLFDSNRTVMSLSQIAKNRVPTKTAEKFKKYKYYAVIRSDGDRMGDIIKALTDDATIRAFSKACLHYCAEAAEIVKEYGGVTIYSGGDDLLALVPVENSSGKTIFDLIQSINGSFAKAFECYHAEVSLSFGVFVSYHKFPLYEALERSADLLFGKAKRYRNCTAIHFQKHAGQSEGVIISNDSLDSFLRLHEEITGGKEENKSEIVLSAMHKLTQFKRMFNHAATRVMIQNLFDNTFDADAHQGNSFLKAALPAFFFDLKDSLHIYSINDDGVIDKCEDTVLAMNYLLRVIKFFTESGGEEQ